MRRLTTVVLSATLAVTAAAVAVTVAGPPRSAGAVEDYPAPADGAFQFTGHGYGHGIGLSQYGARTAAANGLTGSQILDFYYPGTGTAVEGAGSTMRVRLTAAAPTAVPVQGATGLAVRDVASGSVTTLPSATARYRVVADATGMLVQTSTDSGTTWSPIALSGGAASATGPLVFQGPPEIRLYFPNGSARAYEGTLAAVRTGDTTLDTINTVGLDDYVEGVLGAEMPAYWPSSALQAQAVAARTYAAFTRASRPASATWDICDTTQCQVYSGRRLYSGTTVTDLAPASVLAAVAATARQLRTSAGAPIFAQFSASNGGWTVADSRFPYLVAKADPYDAVSNPYATWTTSLTVTRLKECFPAAGTVTRLSVLSRDGNGQWGGRLATVRLTGRADDGSTVTQDVSGSSLRSCGSASGFRTTYATVSSTWITTGAPAAVRWPDERLDVFARGPQGDLYHRTYTFPGRWTPWESFGGVIVGGPAVERRPSGAIVVWARSVTNRLYSGTYQGGTWRGWTSYGGGTATSRPYPAVLPDGTRYVFVRGGDGALWSVSWGADGTARGWQSLGGVLAAAGPAAAGTGPGALTVAAVGTDRAVHLRSLTAGGWSGWRNIGGAASTDIALAAPAAGVLDVYLQADGSQALQTRRAVNGAWGSWATVGGSLATGAWADLVGSDRTEIWYTGTDGAMYLRPRLGSGWGNLYKVPG